MYEIELKAPADHDRLRSIFRSGDFERLDTRSQTDVYYQHPVRDFADSGEALRLRENGRESVSLTYKGPLLDDATKSRVEHETTVSDRDTVDAILTALGFTVAGTVEKRRERFARGDCRFLLDTVRGLSDYLEIETMADSTEDRARKEDRLQEWLEELGLDPQRATTKSYFELLHETEPSG